MKPFYKKNGHINVKQHYGVDGWPVAGGWIKRLRESYRKGALPASVIGTAKAMGIKWKAGSGPK